MPEVRGVRLCGCSGRWGRPLLCQCRASAVRVKGASLRYASATPMALRATLDSARSSTGQKRAGGPEAWGPGVGMRSGGLGKGPEFAGAVASRQHAGSAWRLAVGGWCAGVSGLCAGVAWRLAVGGAWCATGQLSRRIALAACGWWLARRRVWPARPAVQQPTAGWGRSAGRTGRDGLAVCGVASLGRGGAGACPWRGVSVS
jgi:hypothetical protein